MYICTFTCLEGGWIHIYLSEHKWIFLWELHCQRILVFVRCTYLVKIHNATHAYRQHWSSSFSKKSNPECNFTQIDEESNTRISCIFVNNVVNENKTNFTISFIFEYGWGFNAYLSFLFHYILLAFKQLFWTFKMRNRSQYI